mmetsp:Transcript_21023/g.66039  ORF Transcript_21023/g.66039 Transcript_21023/m.66039 type:complete len:363 (+) Transcript_21023:190-1278(+)
MAIRPEVADGIDGLLDAVEGTAQQSGEAAASSSSSTTETNEGPGPEEAKAAVKVEAVKAEASTTKKKKKKTAPPSPGGEKEDEEGGSNNEKTGRWTDEEHTRFLQGLELFGKKWTKVADIVGTRTTVQVRSHAQKYFQKLEKDRAAPAASGQVDRAAPSPKSVSMPGARDRPARQDAEAPARDDAPADARRQSAAPVPLALRRFLPPKIVASGRAGAAELAAGLFKFLSPLAMPKADIPEWYRRGGKLQELLDEAASLDWRDDDGGRRLDDPAKPDPAKPDLHRVASAPASSALNDRPALPRYASFDALCTAESVPAPAAALPNGNGRKRTLSQGSDSLAFDDGLFYDDALYFDEPPPTSLA